MSQNMTRRNFALGAVGAAALFGVAACGNQPPADSGEEPSEGQASEEMPAPPMEVFSYASTIDRVHDFAFPHSNVCAPAYYIYAGTKTQSEADELVRELQLQENLDAWGGTATVVNPIGADYAPEDNDALKELIGVGATNVKLIGIESGATFVNNVLSQDCFYVAGIMCFGGEMDEGLSYNVPVPTYLSGATQTAIDYYRTANACDGEGEGTGGATLYTSSEHELQNVAVGPEGEDLATAFKNAWDNVFEKNYRQCNWVTEFYMLNLNGLNLVGNPLEEADHPGDLLKVTHFDRIGLSVEAHVNESLEGIEGECTWYEYVPEGARDAADGSCPLLLTLHGNNNDPRINVETAGWADVAVAENLLVVSPEWQMPGGDPADPENEGFTNATGLNGMGDDGVIALVKSLLAKYPQIDASRVYVSGLSAGGAKSMYYGVAFGELFAAVASFSGVNNMGAELTEAADAAERKTPLLYLCGDHDQLGMIPVDGSSEHGFVELTEGDMVPQESDPNTHIWPAIQAYQRVCGLEVVENPDMEANEYYGLALENQQEVKLGTRDMLVGSLSDDEGELIRLGAIKMYPHWNYEFEGAYAWEFLRQFSRNQETGALERTYR